MLVEWFGREWLVVCGICYWLMYLIVLMELRWSLDCWCGCIGICCWCFYLFVVLSVGCICLRWSCGVFSWIYVGCKRCCFLWCIVCKCDFVLFSIVGFLCWLRCCGWWLLFWLGCCWSCCIKGNWIWRVCWSLSYIWVRCMWCCGWLWGCFFVLVRVLVWWWCLWRSCGVCGGWLVFWCWI